MAHQMRKSKLEQYQEILAALKNRPLTVGYLSYKTSIDCIILRQRLDFLAVNGLVKERLSSNKKVFAISERGSAVLKALDVQRQLEKAKTTMIAVGRAMQADLTVPTQRRKG
jgi:predicted transcriptional regulator